MVGALELEVSMFVSWHGTLVMHGTLAFCWWLSFCHCGSLYVVKSGSSPFRKRTHHDVRFVMPLPDVSRLPPFQPPLDDFLTGGNFCTLAAPTEYAGPRVGVNSASLLDQIEAVLSLYEAQDLSFVYKA